MDLISCVSRSLYVTVWTSDELVCFLGETDKIEHKIQKHRGKNLQPPIENDPKLESAGEMYPQELEISGDSWKASSTDICIAGTTN